MQYNKKKYSQFSLDDFQKAISLIDDGKYLEFVENIGCDGQFYAQCEGNLSSFTDKLSTADDDLIFEWLEVMIFLFLFFICFFCLILVFFFCNAIFCHFVVK